MLDHIDTSRLFDAVEGTIRLEQGEKAHLHDCERCQEIFCAFITDVLPLRKYARTG
jgi:hypothetical protein